MASAVPLASSPPQVLAYLDAAGIPHSTYRHDPEQGNRIEASIAVKSGHNLVDPSYFVVFHFNDQDRLTSYDVSYLGYVGL